MCTLRAVLTRDHRRQVLALALPIIGGMVSQNVLNLVDTANVYGGGVSEEITGRALKGPAGVSGPPRSSSPCGLETRASFAVTNLSRFWILDRSALP